MLKKANGEEKATLQRMLDRKQEKLRQAELSGSEDELEDEETAFQQANPISRDQKIAIMRQALASESE